MRRLSEHISIAITKLNLIQYDPLTGLLRPDPFYDKVILKLKLLRKRRQEKGSYAMVTKSDLTKITNEADMALAEAKKTAPSTLKPQEKRKISSYTIKIIDCPPFVFSF